MFRLRLLFALMACLVATSVRAELNISLLTFHPGEEFFQLEGHTGLRIIDTDAGTDITYNWGTFDFTTPGFALRFCKGQTDYLVDGQPTAWILPYYIQRGRRVTELPLRLNDAEAAKLKALVDENMRPENRTYRYNYVLDNCATRPLAMISESVEPDSLTLGEAPSKTQVTFRQMMRKYHVNYPWYQFGIDLALGSGIDKPIDNDAKAFAPVELEHMLDYAVVDDGVGDTHSLTGTMKVIYEGKPGGATLGATPWYATPKAVCWLFFAVIVALTWRDFLRRHPSAWVDTLVFGIYGIAGLAITFLVFVSEHEATSPNWLLLWLNPLCLLGAIAVWVKKWQRLEMLWQIINFALTSVLALIGLAGVQQLNGAFWPLMMAGMLRSVSYISITVDNNDSSRNLLHALGRGR